VFPGTKLAYDANLASTIQSSAEYKYVTQSPSRMALGADQTDATGASNPYDRAKVYAAYGYGLTGAGVKVGVVDTGFNLVNGAPSHQEFSTTGKITVLASSAPLQSDAHGAHVSGLAVGDRNGVGMQGVAYGASLYLGMAPTEPVAIKAIWDEYTAQGVLVSSNSYGLPVTGSEASPWKPVATLTGGGLEVTSKNALAYRDANGLSSAQMMVNVSGTGTTADWLAAVDSMKAFQDKGGVIVWANSNYGPNGVANGEKGLDDADLNASFPLVFTQLQGAWITVVNATSKGLAGQLNGADYVSKSPKQENNIYLNSAPCGLAANFCISMDGAAAYSASNTGVSSYTEQTGTSQATPQVAGMIALLRQAFPAASAADLTARLLYTADNSFFIGSTVSKLSLSSYTNANGTITQTVSDIWGHGFPDIQKALNPVGTARTTSVAGNSIVISNIAGKLQLGSAFGTGGNGLTKGYYLYNDMLNGIFAKSLSNNVVTSPDPLMRNTLGSQILSREMVTVANNSGMTLSYAETSAVPTGPNEDRPNRVFLMTQKVGVGGQLQLGAGVSSDTVLGFSPRQSNLRSASPTDTAMGLPYVSLGNSSQKWLASSWPIPVGRLALAAFSSSAIQLTPGFRNTVSNGGTSSGLVADFLFDPAKHIKLNASFGELTEKGSYLGSTSSNTFMRGDAVSPFARLGVSWSLAPWMTLQANYATARTAMQSRDGGLLTGPTTLRSDAAAINLAFDHWMGGALTLGVNQPLRVSSGAATLSLPQQVVINGPGDYHYTYQNNGVNLAPSGRELDYTVDFSKHLNSRVSFSVSGSILQQPGHDASAPIGYRAIASFRVAL
jgi:subtilase-type serine protease